MEKLRQSVAHFTSLEDLISDGSSQLFHQVVASMHDLCFHILEAEKSGAPRDKIAEIIKPARDIHGRSIFVKRMQDWPRKYPGDFETIEYLCDLENKSLYGKVEYYIEEYALNSAIAQQLRNKIQLQSWMILDTLLTGNRGKKILSVGCGGSRDFFNIAKYISDVPCDIVLHDVDNDALDLSKERLSRFRGRVHTIHGNFLQALRVAEKQGPFDLILAGGLFDYISDKHISFFLKRSLEKLLNRKSLMFFANIKKGNPYKVWQEYLADWQLLYRSEEEIMGLLTGSGFPGSAITLGKDETGLAMLATVKKQGE
jgi:SAM-dependent methyltransferase